MNHPLKQRILGVFRLGNENVQLVAAWSHMDGGELHLTPDDIGVGRIKVGLDAGVWRDVVAVLLHEAFEYALIRYRARLAPTTDGVMDHGGYIFLYTHSQFSQICDDVGGFIAPALPVLAEAFEKYKKRK